MMANVIVLDFINEDIFVCGMCKSVFYSLEVFLDHKRSKCSSEVLQNILTIDPSSELPTSSSFADKPAPTLHQENAIEGTEACCETPRALTVSQDLPCDKCGKKFKNKKTLGAHMKYHYVKPYQCLVCGRCFNQNSHLQRHFLSHKVWPESVSETTAKSSNLELLSYCCPFCKVIFSNYNKFRSHLKNHQSMKKYKCIQGDCVYFFESLDGLLQHVSSVHITPLYFCCICEKPFSSLESVATHQQSHDLTFGKDDTQARLYKCLQCDAVFKKPEKLSLHMLTENHKKMCIHCNKTFASDKRLRLHLQIHRNIKPYQCSICNSSFHMKKYLTNHMLKHGKREFKCSICKNMFKRQDLLQRHMKLHQSNKLLKCPFKDVSDCKKEFSRQDKLKLHVRSHMKHSVLSEANQENSEACNTTGFDG